MPTRPAPGPAPEPDPAPTPAPGPAAATAAATDLDESIRSFVEAFSRLAARFPGSRCEPYPGGTAAWSGTPLPFLNNCFVDAPAAAATGDAAGRSAAASAASAASVASAASASAATSAASAADTRPALATLRRHLDAARAYAAARGQPWFAVVCTDRLPAGWQDVVAGDGLHVAMPITGMVAEALLPPRRPPPGLSLRRVGDEASRRAVAELHDRAYDLPAGMCDCLASEGLWPDDVFGVVGSVGGEDVSTATAWAQGEALYVAMVATRPGHGRRGYGERVMREALRLAGAATGRDPAVRARTILHATDAGRPVYAAMGYRDTARFVLLSTEEHG
jgi:ribosomal protein S18 acetylase RimI-like enzyme